MFFIRLNMYHNNMSMLGTYNRWLPEVIDKAENMRYDVNSFDAKKVKIISLHISINN